MKARSRITAKLQTSKEEFVNPFRPDQKIVLNKTTKGIVNFSSSARIITDPVALEKLNKLPHGVDVWFAWETYNQLQIDHGLAAIYGSPVLDITGSDGENLPKMLAEIRGAVGKETWQNIQQRLSELDNPSDETGRRRAFIVALWANQFCEPFSEPWLAAMALYAYDVKGSSFALGCFTTLADQKAMNEAHVLRGQAVLHGANKSGGKRSRIPLRFWRR